MRFSIACSPKSGRPATPAASSNARTSSRRTNCGSIGRLSLPRDRGRGEHQAVLDARLLIDDSFNAFITTVDHGAGGSGPFAGMTLAVKDLFDTAGVRTTYGSALYREHV